MKITQSQLRQIIKEELEAIAQEGCGGPIEPDEPETVDLVGMDADDAYGFALENAIDALRRSGMEDAASLLQIDVAGARTSLGEPYEAPAGLREEEKMNIGKMDLKKGRCTPMGTPECPEGSPQYNLAKRFKSGDIHKANLKKGKNPHGPG